MREKERRRYANMGEEKRAVLKERRRRAYLVKKKRAVEKGNALGPLTPLTIPLTDYLKSSSGCSRARLAEKKRTLEKRKALGPLTLTIPLTDCLKSIPVTAYVQAFCDSLDSEDTNVLPTEDSVDSADTGVLPTESFVQLLEEDSHTLTDMDSGAMQVVDPPDWGPLSSLLQNISPDEWAEVLKDVEESSSFDLEALLPPEDLVHDMSSDEGIDLLYDLVT